MTQKPPVRQPRPVATLAREAAPLDLPTGPAGRSFVVPTDPPPA